MAKKGLEDFLRGSLMEIRRSEEITEARRWRMSKPSKYVVLYEAGTGYMDCVAICDKPAEAYGEAYLALIDGLDEDSYYVTLPVYREGENGFIIHAVDKATQKILSWVTILFYRPRTEIQMEIKAAYTDILNGVKEQQTIEPERPTEPQERKTGRWINVDTVIKELGAECFAKRINGDLIALGGIENYAELRGMEVEHED